MRTRVALLALTLAAISSSAGCSAARMGMFVAGTHFGEHYTTSVTPEGRVEERIIVVETPPPPEPPPEPSTVDEAPLPAPPLPPPPPEVLLPVPPPPPEPPVVVEVPPPPPCLCELQRRHESELVIGGYRQFGTIEKLVLGMFTLFDGVVAISTLTSALDRGEGEELDYGVLTIGTLAAADALGLLAIIVLMPPVDTAYEERRPGVFRPVETFPCECGTTDTSQACPSGHTTSPPA